MQRYCGWGRRTDMYAGLSLSAVSDTELRGLTEQHPRLQAKTNEHGGRYVPRPNRRGFLFDDRIELSSFARRGARSADRDDIKLEFSMRQRPSSRFRMARHRVGTFYAVSQDECLAAGCATNRWERGFHTCPPKN